MHADVCEGNFLLPGGMWGGGVGSLNFLKTRLGDFSKITHSCVILGRKQLLS